MIVLMYPMLVVYSDSYVKKLTCSRWQAGFKLILIVKYWSLVIGSHLNKTISFSRNLMFSVLSKLVSKKWYIHKLNVLNIDGILIQNFVVPRHCKRKRKD